jgi:hypothetical protein
MTDDELQLFLVNQLPTLIKILPPTIVGCPCKFVWIDLNEFVQDREWLQVVNFVEDKIKYDEVEREKYESALLDVLLSELGYQGADQLIHASWRQRAKALVKYYEDYNRIQST